MFRAVYSMIHDVILWNGGSLKQNLFQFQGEYLTGLITKLLHGGTERSGEDWHSEELAHCLIWDHFQIVPLLKSIMHLYSTGHAFLMRPYDETALSDSLL